MKVTILIIRQHFGDNAIESNLDFKGSSFENRTKAGCDINKIRNSRLYKKTDETEYECDVAFVIENDIFFVECKAHVQPYTTRQHANHLYKLYKETFQQDNNSSKG